MLMSNVSRACVPGNGSAVVLTCPLWLCSQLEFPLACPVCKAGPSPACVHCEEVVRGHTNERYCSIDPDVQLVLSPEEYEDYMDKSMKFASNRDSELTSCPKPDCQVSLHDDTVILLSVRGARQQQQRRLGCVHVSLPMC